MQGFDKPIYTNVKYPFDGQPPFVPTDNQPVSTEPFELLEQAAPGRPWAYLYDGVNSSVPFAWCNGKWVGYSPNKPIAVQFSV
ncbi:hypothetical protein O9992_05255 [Vibrio lentus]|nr:hypothetical protein [Vibrio lentus]